MELPDTQEAGINPTNDDLKDIFDIAELQENLSGNNSSNPIGLDLGGDTLHPPMPPRPKAPKVEFTPDNIGNIYSQLSDLINTGNDILGNVQYLINNNSIIDPEMVASVASLINSISSMVKEFNKTHMMHVKFEQMKEFEIMKAKERRKILKYKVNEAKKLMGKEDAKDITGSITYCQEDVINTIVQSEQKQITTTVEK
jgi:hypothetical protein